MVRKGHGITGTSVAHVSPHISGRLNMAMLQQMKITRQEVDQLAVKGEEDSEQDRIKKLLRLRERQK